MLRIHTAVFPVAGWGTRFLPATKASPKEMIPVVDRPLIQYAVEEAVAAGIERIILITGREKRAIEDHFDRVVELEHLLEQRGETGLLQEVQRLNTLASFTAIRQGEALGLGHAVLCARDAVGEHPFAVFLPDDIIDADVPCMAQMVELYARYEAPMVAVEEVPWAETHRYGVIQGEEVAERIYRITDMVEKPSPEEAPSNLAIIGRYILTPDLFPFLEKVQPDRRGEIQLTDGIRQLLKERPVYGYRFAGARYDAGSKLGFLKATIAFALKRPDLAPALREFLQSLS
ncbi:MAG: UTP--glucose-1-phosphate uridylyltransferase [Nitrospinota bacterium]|nr:MAG: UTP--glucose-1-phosphate uridylyltransferase [Nitrospinota bacterium]